MLVSWRVAILKPVLTPTNKRETMKKNLSDTNGSKWLVLFWDPYQGEFHNPYKQRVVIIQGGPNNQL